jgi:hypothetical protein
VDSPHDVVILLGAVPSAGGPLRVGGSNKTPTAADLAVQRTADRSRASGACLRRGTRHAAVRLPRQAAPALAVPPGAAGRLQRARRGPLARRRGSVAGRRQRGSRLRVSAAAETPSPAGCRAASCQAASARRAAAPGGRGVRTSGRQGTPGSAAVGGPVRAAADTPSPLGGPRLALGCQATSGESGAGAPNIPAAERGTPQPRKVEGLFPARLGEPSRAAEPVKATPCGWLEDSPALTEPAALPQCVVAWPEKCRCEPRPREVPARRASVALPLVAAARATGRPRAAGLPQPGAAGAPACWAAWCRAAARRPCRRCAPPRA